MGTTGLLVMSNKRPEYLEKIILASLLAPVAYMEHIETPLKLIAPFVDSIEVMYIFFTSKSLRHWKIFKK